jgi:hypothetical protein
MIYYGQKMREGKGRGNGHPKTKKERTTTMNTAENIRAYEIDDDGRAVIDMKTVAYKSRQTHRAVRLDLAAQARNESDETLRRVVEHCAGTYLAKVAARELARRVA